MTNRCLCNGFHYESCGFRDFPRNIFALFRRLLASIFRRTGFDDFGKQCQQRLSAVV